MAVATVVGMDTEYRKIHGAVKRTPGWKLIFTKRGHYIALGPSGERVPCGTASKKKSRDAALHNARLALRRAGVPV